MSSQSNPGHQRFTCEPSRRGRAKQTRPGRASQAQPAKAAPGQLRSTRVAAQPRRNLARAALQGAKLTQPQSWDRGLLLQWQGSAPASSSVCFCRFPLQPPLVHSVATCWSGGTFCNCLADPGRRRRCCHDASRDAQKCGHLHPHRPGIAGRFLSQQTMRES